jgi:hypothetical protein
VKAEKNCGLSIANFELKPAPQGGEKQAARLREDTTPGRFAARVGKLREILASGRAPGTQKSRVQR